jgi:hypothetical protein
LGSSSDAKTLISLTVVTRTLGNRSELLDRNIASVQELKSKWGPWVEVKHLIVAPNTLPEQKLGLGAGFLLTYAKKEGEDSRWDAIEHAASAIETDFVLFLDDDDWVQVGSSTGLPQELAESKYDSHWIPGEFSGQSILHKKLMRLLGSRFTYDPKFFHLSISPTVNLTPFPCVIYRASLVQAAVKDLSVLRPVFREDHLIFILAAAERPHRIEVDGPVAQIDLLSKERTTLPFFKRRADSAKIYEFLQSSLVPSSRGIAIAGVWLRAFLRLRISLSRWLVVVTS